MTISFISHRDKGALFMNYTKTMKEKGQILKNLTMDKTPERFLNTTLTSLSSASTGPTTLTPAQQLQVDSLNTEITTINKYLNVMNDALYLPTLYEKLHIITLDIMLDRPVADELNYLLEYVNNTLNAEGIFNNPAISTISSLSELYEGGHITTGTLTSTAKTFLTSIGANSDDSNLFPTVYLNGLTAEFDGTNLYIPLSPLANKYINDCPDGKTNTAHNHDHNTGCALLQAARIGIGNSGYNISKINNLITTLNNALISKTNERNSIIASVNSQSSVPANIVGMENDLFKTTHKLMEIKTFNQKLEIGGEAVRYIANNFKQLKHSIENIIQYNDNSILSEQEADFHVATVNSIRNSLNTIKNSTEFLKEKLFDNNMNLGGVIGLTLTLDSYNDVVAKTELFLGHDIITYGASFNKSDPMNPDYLKVSYNGTLFSKNDVKAIENIEKTFLNNYNIIGNAIQQTQELETIHNLRITNLQAAISGYTNKDIQTETLALMDSVSKEIATVEAVQNLQKTALLLKELIT